MPHPGNFLRPCPIQLNRFARTGSQSSSTSYTETNTGRLPKCGDRNMAQTKEQIKTPEKELSNKEMASLSGAEFKTQVIRMLTEMIELTGKMKEEMKAMQSQIKENIQGTKSKGKEMGVRTKDLKQNEKETSN